MNENEFRLAAQAWLEEGPAHMSDRGLQSALEEIHATRQRRTGWPAWKAKPVSTFAGLAIAAVLVVGVGLLAINVVPRQPEGPGVGGRSPSASPARVLDFPDLTTTFISPRNGFSVRYFDRGQGSVTPASRNWGSSPRADDSFDVVETGLAAVFKGASTALWPGDRLCFDESEQPTPCPSLDEEIDGLVSSASPDGCGVPRSQQAEITIDGQSGRVAECAHHIEATAAIAGRLYLFTLSHNRTDARAVFDTFLATIDLTPWTADDLPVLTGTFVSPTYGYSFASTPISRGGRTPATELWDPSNQPIEDIDHDPRFDAVETGLGAYLEGASTAIPEGVSIDAWVDEYVTPLDAGRCGVPRSQQEEVTIDGQAGRVAECGNRGEATVVAAGRLYLFVAYLSSNDVTAWFHSWIATIDLRPEDAAVPSASPSP